MSVLVINFNDDAKKRTSLKKCLVIYLAIQTVQTSLGPCRRGHNTCTALNETSLDFEFSLEVLLKFDVAFLAGTLKSLV